MDKKLELLKELTDINGISGHEREVRKVMEREFLEVVSKKDISYDGLGSIIAKKEGTSEGPKIVIAGHMDEVGLMVTKITKEGYLKFQTIGGWWSQVMLAQQFILTTSEGKEFVCVMGSKPPHILSPEEKNSAAKIEDMYLDLGVKDKEAVEKLGVKVGDAITPAIQFKQMADPNYLLAKAWDNRIGCAIVIETLKRLKNGTHPNTVYGVGTVQEELGCRGAKTVGNMINPDIVFALDVGIAKDVPGCDMSAKMGDGPVILLRDSGLMGHPALRQKVIEVAEELKISYQIDYLPSGGTDAGPLHLAYDGAPAMSLCIASRYIHSHTSMINYQDYESCVSLLVEVIKRLSKEVVDKITYE